MKDELRRLLDAAYPNQIRHVAVTIGGIAYIEVFHEVARNVVDTVQSLDKTSVQSQEGITKDSLQSRPTLQYHLLAPLPP